MRFFYLLFLLLLLNACFNTEEEVDALYKDWTPKKFYNQAKLELANGELEKALDLFKRLQANYPASKYAPQSRLDTAYALYDSKEYEDALAAFDHYIDLYPNGKSLDYAYYMRGIISEEQSRSLLDGLIVDSAQKNIKGTQDALRYYALLINRFPNSKYSKEAVARLPHLQKDLAKHELLVAAFYYRKKSYVASANRLQYLIQYYPNTAATPIALTLLAKTYAKIGLSTQQADIEKILDLNYPNLVIDLKKELDI